MQKVSGICLPDNDTHFAEALRKTPMVGGKATYQLHKLTAALVHCKQKRIAIDIGGHVGLWTRILAMHFDRVCVFEPVLEYMRCLEMNCAGLDNIALFEVALGKPSDSDLPGVCLRVERVNSGNTHVATDANGPVVTTAIGALDVVLPIQYLPHLDFMKIDVEGYEHDVILGAEQTIRAAKPTMVVEQKPGNAERYGRKTGDALDLLKGWGARIVWEKAGDYCLTWSG